MPLLDHFRPPLVPMRSWESFHTIWCSAITARLNQGILPPGYFAEAQVHVGGRIEVDVPTFEGAAASPVPPNGPVATATAPASAPPVPALTMPAVFPDEIEVLVLGGPTGPHLVAAIELVSPGNKDRSETRRTFAIKCASYLSAGVGLMIVDVVTERLANLHDVLIDLLQQPAEYRFAGGAALYSVAYRPVHREESGDQIEMWPTPLVVGQVLPTMPLALRGAATVPVDLEAAYTDARQQSRL